MKNSNSIKKAKYLLEAFFREKSIRDESDFEFHEDKKQGSKSGAFYRDENYDIYLIKSTCKLTHLITSSKYGERRDWFHEYIMSPFYKRFLYNHAPKIELVESLAKSEIISLSSRFLQNFVNLDISIPSDDITDNIRANIIIGEQAIKGFEKIMAVSAFLADFGYHCGNIGVIKHEEDGELYAARVDYGRSAYFFDKSAIDLLARLARGIEAYNLNNIAIEVDNFLAEVQQITKLSEDEIRNFLGYQFYKLEKQNYDVSDPHRSRSFRNFAHYSKEQAHKFTGKERETFFPFKEIIIVENSLLDESCVEEETLIQALQNDESYRGKLFRENYKYYVNLMNSHILEDFFVYQEKYKKFLQYREAEDFYFEKLLGHLNLFQELEISLEIINQAKFINEQEFKKGLWLQESKDSRFTLEILLKRWDKIINQDHVKDLLKAYKTISSGNTILMEAILFGDLDLVKFLVKEVQIDIEIINIEGKTARNIAEENNFNLIVDFLTYLDNNHVVPFHPKNYLTCLISNKFIEFNTDDPITLSYYDDNGWLFYDYISSSEYFFPIGNDNHNKLQNGLENIPKINKEHEISNIISIVKLIRNSDCIIYFFKIYGWDLSFFKLSDEIKFATELATNFIFYQHFFAYKESFLYSFSYYIYSKELSMLNKDNFNLVYGFEETCLDEFVTYSASGFLVGSPASGIINSVQYCLKENHVVTINTPFRDDIKIILDNLVMLLAVNYFSDFRISALDKFILVTNSVVITDVAINSVFGVIDYFWNEIE